jgi:arabinofuranosyltransferase
MKRLMRELGLVRWAVLVLLAVVAYAGWREFWFLTDDAYITFRYISNHVRGWGYTWNPPPFRPVEGYSNFLWMVLLEGVWRVTGVDPPGAANAVSLLLSYGTLALGFAWVWRMHLPPALARYRFALAVAVLVGVLSHRTFLTWMSSGLETALFIFCTTLWAVATVELGRGGGPRALAVSCAAASFTALTRPDGQLMVLASGLLVVGSLVTAPPRGRWVLAGLPLLMDPAHLLWRRAYYGEWVPNTYFAKHVAAWPESGLHYALSFTLEYGVWVWLGVGLVASVAVVRRRGVREIARALRERPGAIAVAAVLAAHFAYYTLIIGGDHFEYRVYAHLVLPVMVSFVGCLAWLEVSPRAAMAWGALFLLVSLPVQWIHYARTRELTTREQTRNLIMPVADAFPAFVRPYAALYDAQQDWLIHHLVGVRQTEHKALYELQMRMLPPREVGEQLKFDDPWTRPVLVWLTVGVPSWAMPEVAILDGLGLNDRVVARTPLSADQLVHRTMAHDRRPPPGYFECFEPNMTWKAGKFRLADRKEPLTDERIRECEARFDPVTHPPAVPAQ